MKQQTDAAGTKQPDQREALKQSEKNASVDQPGSFKDRETEEKIVRIDPVDSGDDAIKGIDPDSKPTR